MSDHTYRLVHVRGTEWTRHATVLRDDGARFEGDRRLGAFGPLFARIVRDSYANEVVRMPVPPWSAEHSALAAVAGKSLSLTGEPIEGEHEIGALGTGG